MDMLGSSEDKPCSSPVKHHTLWPHLFPTLHPVLGTESSGPSPGSRCTVGARLPWGRNEASTRAHIPELKTDEPQARDQRGAQAWGWVEETVTPRLGRAPSEHALCQKRH